MKRICLDLADGEGVLPLERAGLVAIASNCRAAILDAQIGNQFANTVPSHGFFGRLVISLKLLFRLGERAGARTQDPVIKSHVLYRLSYALPWPLMAFKIDRHRLRTFEKHVLPLPQLASRGKTGCFRIMLSARAV